MSSQIPYQLRLNKYVDRALFLDLLVRACACRGAERYVYISMGGKHLVDHKLVYQRVGIEDAVCFDGSELVVKRQRFNASMPGIFVEHMHSSQVGSLIESLDELYFESRNYAVWLDYTDGRSRKEQFDEFMQLLKVAQPYDIFRVSFSAEAGSLEWNLEETKQSTGLKRNVQLRLSELRRQLGHLIPSSVEGVSNDNFGRVLISALEIAVSEVERQMRALCFRPILLTEYRDGARMVTACVQAFPKGDQDSIERQPNMANWEHLCLGWDDINSIGVPDLSIKEKEYLDARVGQDAQKVCNSLGFEFDEDLDRSVNAVKSYWRHRKYYPTFRAIEV